MNGITLKYYITKPFAAAKAIATKPLVLVTVAPVVAIEAFSIEIKAVALLFIFFWLDFATGIGASYVEFRKGLPPKEPGAPKRYVIKSAKLRLSAVKFIIYGLSVLIAKGIQYVFVPNQFKLHDNINTMTITVMVTAFLCAIEVYSIVFENFKRMGFDVIEQVKKLIGKYKSVKKEIEE